MSDAGVLDTVPLPDDVAADDDVASYGRFVSLGVIGGGGMGVVLRARDPELDRLVAIKVLEAAPSGLRRRAVPGL